MKRGKIIILSAPSGSGKSSIISGVRNRGIVEFSFSVSATNRPPRPGEKHGKEYYFLTEEDFMQRLGNNEFVEYCEVYPGRYYGTLKSEIDEKCGSGQNVVLDVDVEGGLRIKEIYGDEALSIFIMPPSIEELKRRLESRGTDSADKICERISRADYEISMAPKYDVIIENRDLAKAVLDTEMAILKFIEE